MAAFAPRDMEADPPEPPAPDPGEEGLITFHSDDPFERINRISYAISQPIDNLLLRPLALVYKTVVPKPLRDGARNALANLYIPPTFVNDVAQRQPGLAMHTLERFVINSTLGLGGVFDVAKRKPFGLPPHSNGASNTLAVYGADPGPYFYLPILGPTTSRDLIGAVADAFTQPLLLNKVTTQRVVTVKKRKVSLFSSSIEITTAGAVSTVVGGLDQRAENDAALQAIRHQSVDPYAALRSSYLQNRAGDIAALKHGRGAAPLPDALDDPLADPAAAKPADPPKGQ